MRSKAWCVAPQWTWLDSRINMYIVRGDFLFSKHGAKMFNLPWTTMCSACRWIWYGLISWEIHVNDIPDQWNLHDGCTQSCCFPVEEDMNGNHCRDLVFAHFTKPLHDSGQVNNVSSRILGNLSMQQLEIFVGTHMTLKLSLALERFSNDSYRTTTHHLCMIS